MSLEIIKRYPFIRDSKRIKDTKETSEVRRQVCNSEGKYDILGERSLRGSLIHILYLEFGSPKG